MKVTLKLATSLDGRIALSDGTSQWITSSEARARVHEMRAAHDAVVVGVGTVLADDPLLTARTVPLPARQPWRIVVDSQARTPAASRLAGSLSVGPVAVATAQAAGDALRAAGVEVWACGAGEGGVSLRGLLDRCAVEGISSLFVEGGGQLAASFAKAGLVDRVEWFRAPVLIGGDGRAAIAPLGLTSLSDAPAFERASMESIGPDTLETLVRRPG